MYKQLVPDEKPLRIHVTVRGKNVQIRLYNELAVNYAEPTPRYSRRRRAGGAISGSWHVCLAVSQ